MPFIRLITIYVIVIVAVLAIFNREKVMQLAGISPEWRLGQADDDARPTDEEKSGTPDEEVAVTGIATPTEQVEATAQEAPASAPEPQETATVEVSTTTAATEDTGQTEPDAVEEPIAEPAYKEPVPAVTAQTPLPEPLGTPKAEPPGTLVAEPQPVDGGAQKKSALEAARKTFWEGDRHAAEAAYLGLAQQYPDDADMQGETGNFYFSQRKYRQAAEYFHKAGELLIEKRDWNRLRPVINVLQGIAPDLAADLRAKAAN